MALSRIVISSNVAGTWWVRAMPSRACSSGDARVTSAPYLLRQAPALGGVRLFVLGDAAGYIEPFTGEGMAWALAGAGLVTPLAIRGVRNGWDPELLVRWRGAYHRKVTRRQIICRITADLLRRPIATQVMVRSLSFAPWLSRPLFRIMYRD